jgi:hypothetical protein
MAVDGKGVAFTTAGFIILWSGIKGDTLKDTLTSLLHGQNPAATAATAPTIGAGSGTATGALMATTAAPAGGTYTTGQLEQLWTSCGGDASTASVAACIAGKESSGDASVTSPNPDGGQNVGLWQLDTKGVGAGYSVGQLQDPVTNCHVTIMGSRNGTNWSDWSTAAACGV